MIIAGNNFAGGAAAPCVFLAFANYGRCQNVQRVICGEKYGVFLVLGRLKKGLHFFCDMLKCILVEIGILRDPMTPFDSV